MSDYYRTLELEPGASEQEIKRAYFRLIRTHTPDKDPEGFMKIREAYEQLKSGNTMSDGPVFPAPSDPTAQAIRASIEQALSFKNMEKVMEIAEFATALFPDDPYILYHLQIAQRRLGKTGKAVKTGEKLIALDPKNPYYSKELTFSYLERGYIKKAIRQYQISWTLNVRDLELTAVMVSLSQDRNYNSFGYSAAMNFLREKNVFSKEEMDPALFLFFILLDMTEEMSVSLKEPIEMALAFAEKHYALLDQYRDSFILKFVLTAAKSDLPDSVVKQVFDFADQHRGDMSSSVLETIDYFKKNRLNARIMTDEMLLPELRRLATTERKDYTDPSLYEYTCLDYQLTLMKKAESFPGMICNEILYLHRKYPEAYERQKEFYNLFLDLNALKKKMHEYRVRFRRLSVDYEGAGFYELFPEEKRLSLPEASFKAFAQGENKRKFGRALVGRNEPCPCGSGKKFKKCCMGKGIFD